MRLPPPAGRFSIPALRRITFRQRRRKRCGRRKPLVRISGKAAKERSLQVGWNPFKPPLNGQQWLAEMRLHNLLRSALIRRVAREHAGEQGPNSIDIRPGIDTR